MTEKRKKRKPIFNDATLQEAQDIFGVDFDYDDFEKYDDEYYEEEEDEEDEYEDEEQRSARLAFCLLIIRARRCFWFDITPIVVMFRRAKKQQRKKRKQKSIYELYEPSELERAGLTEEDNRIRNKDVPERMQLRSVPVTDADEEEIKEEALWIYDLIFAKRKPDHLNLDTHEKVARTVEPASANKTAKGKISMYAVAF